MSNIILHIPHSSTYIPTDAEYLKDISHDISRLTDYDTDIIFDIPDSHKLIFNYSRFYCDVERFLNDPMENVGMGYYYTKNLNNETIRTNRDKHKVLKLYTEHHRNLTLLCDNAIREHGNALIIDCHSFGDTISNPNNIDVCIGVNHKDDIEGVKRAILFLEGTGFTVGINDPYGGSIVPSKYINDPRVKSVMIELNKNLYIDDDNKSMVYLWNSIINTIVHYINSDIHTKES